MFPNNLLFFFRKNIVFVFPGQPSLMHTHTGVFPAGRNSKLPYAKNFKFGMEVAPNNRSKSYSININSNKPTQTDHVFKSYIYIKSIKKIHEYPM